MSEDHNLLKQLERGDREALRSIYEKYVEELLAVAVSLLGNFHAAEDCLHDVFTSFAGAAGRRIKVRRNLKRYLVSCVANRARDQLRKKDRRSNSLLEELDCPATADNPIRRLIEAEESARLFETLTRIPYGQREVFVLHTQGGLRFREIGDLLGISTNTVKSRYHYSIEKIRMLMK